MLGGNFLKNFSFPLLFFKLFLKALRATDVFTEFSSLFQDEGPKYDKVLTPLFV